MSPPVAGAEGELDVVLPRAVKVGRRVVNPNRTNEEAWSRVHVQRATEFSRERVVTGADRTGRGCKVRDTEQDMRRDVRFTDNVVHSGQEPEGGAAKHRGLS